MNRLVQNAHTCDEVYRLIKNIIGASYELFWLDYANICQNCTTSSSIMVMIISFPESHIDARLMLKILCDWLIPIYINEL